MGLAERDEFRAKWLPDGRRMSFKQLGDGVRRRALPAFLSTANRISGNTITILVDRRVRSFMGDTEVWRKLFPDCFLPSTKPGTIEKMMRISSLVAVLTAGLRDESQPSLWISDDDEALATFERREGLGRLSSYLTFGLTRWHAPAELEFGTTGSIHAPEWAGVG